MGNKTWGMRSRGEGGTGSTGCNFSNGKTGGGRAFLSLSKYVFKIITENNVEFLQAGLREEDKKCTKAQQSRKNKQRRKNIKTGSLQAAVPDEVISKGPRG